MSKGQMRRWLVVVLAVCVLPAVASLEDAYQSDPNYLTAVRAVTTAEDGVAKVEADPDNTAFALARAQETLAEARALCSQAQATAMARVGQALVDVLNTQALAKTATAKRGLASLQLEAITVKAQSGAASQQELAQSKDAYAKAQVAETDAARELADAEKRLRVYGDMPTVPLAAPPTLDVKTLTVNAHPVMIQTNNLLNEAKRALAIAGGPDTARLDKEAAERALADAQAAEQDVRRTHQDALDTAVRQYQSAQETLTLAQSALTLATTAAETARKRFAAGSISRLALTDAETALTDADGRRVQALTAVWVAHYGLLQAIGGLP
jgi:outer membrane protein TolC